MKKYLSFRIKYFILLNLQRFKEYDYFKNFKIDNTRNKVYIFLAADYGNLGDVAITYAQTEFLKKYTNYQVIEIPISKSLEGFWFVKNHIKSGDIVTTVGGGNMGELYDQIEYIRQLTIRFFPKNKIISFPQTFDFTESNEGKKALSIATKVYGKHKKLVIVAREKISYNLMKANFKNNKVILTPDIVLSLNKVNNSSSERKGVLFCLRQDKEKSLSKEQNQEIIDIAKSHFSQYQFYDTHIGKNNLTIEERNLELNKIWDKFRNAELVITDRLHGMIFCYITNTPCIVFPNNNHKVKETVKWLPKDSNIRLIDSYSKNNFKKNIEDLEFYQNSYEPLIEKYEMLIKELN